MLSAPTSTAPAASSRSISVASRAAGGVVAVDLRAGKRRKPCDVEQVLHRERHAGERPERLAVARAPHRALAPWRARVSGHGGERVEHRIALARCGRAPPRPPTCALRSPSATAACDLRGGCPIHRAASGLEHRRRLGLVRQRESRRPARRGAGSPEVGCAPPASRLVDRQSQRAGACGDQVVERIAATSDSGGFVRPRRLAAAALAHARALRRRVIIRPPSGWHLRAPPKSDAESPPAVRGCSRASARTAPARSGPPRRSCRRASRSPGRTAAARR